MSIICIQSINEKKNHIRYEVDTDSQPLGVGGMGSVYRGKRIQEKTGVCVDVAIKFLFDDLPAHVIERARREASIQIHNENLVEMFGFIQIDEVVSPTVVHQHYHVVSELLHGVVLCDLLKGKTTDNNGVDIPFAQELYNQYVTDRCGFALLVIKNILSGIMALHDKGYIHRDLDPSNIMITSDRKIKIIDYGIAKQLSTLTTQDQQLTTAGQFMGKATYASPELVVGDVVHQNETTDIYAIGIMLFQFIVGHVPFEGATHEVLEMQLQHKMPLQQVPQKEIRKIIAKATAKKQKDRYQSAAEFRVAVEQISKISMPSATEQEKFGNIIETVQAIVGKMGQKNVWAAVFIVVVLIGGSITWKIIADNKEKQQAELERIETEKRIAAWEAEMNNTILDSSVPSGQRVTDSISGHTVMVKTAGQLTLEAFTLLSDSGKAVDGLNLLEKVAQKGYRSSLDAAYLVARLHYPGEDSSDSIQQIKNYLSETLKKDGKDAHQMMSRIVKTDSTYYKALYELGCDFLAGEIRTGKADSRDLPKALEYFKRGLTFATQANDNEYISKCSRRIEALQ